MAYLCVSLIGKSIQNSPRHLFSRCEVGDIFIIKDSFPFQEMITEDPTYGPDETGLGASMCDLEATKHQDGTQWDWNSSRQSRVIEKGAVLPPSWDRHPGNVKG